MLGGGGGGGGGAPPSKSALATCTILDGFFPNLTQMSTTMTGCVKGQGHRGHSIFCSWAWGYPSISRIYVFLWFCLNVWYKEE